VYFLFRDSLASQADSIGVIRVRQTLCWSTFISYAKLYPYLPVSSAAYTGRKPFSYEFHLSPPAIAYPETVRGVFVMKIASNLGQSTEESRPWHFLIWTASFRIHRIPLPFQLLEDREVSTFFAWHALGATW
jgi:hypothetical protein